MSKWKKYVKMSKSENLGFVRYFKIYFKKNKCYNKIRYQKKILKILKIYKIILFCHFDIF